MLIKYNFTEVDTEALKVLVLLKEKQSTPFNLYEGWFVMESVGDEGYIAYDRSNKVMLLDSIEPFETVSMAVAKQCMKILLNKIVGITTDSESVEHAFKIASNLGIEVSNFDFNAHKKDTLTIYFDDINEMYYAQ